MKRAFVTWGALLGGALLGATAFGIPLWWHWESQFRDWYILSVVDQAEVVTQILRGQGDELARRNLERLPEHARAMAALEVPASARNAALWKVRDAYEASGHAPPPEIVELLRDLPPRETCKLPNRGLR